MQPQEGGGFEWMHAVSALGGAVVGAVSGLIAGVFGLAERGIRTEIAAAEQRMDQKFSAAINAVEKRADQKIDEEIGHFRETLSGLREQFNKSVTREDLSAFRKEIRDDFATHRKESREDAAALERTIAVIVGGRKS